MEKWKQLKYLKQLWDKVLIRNTTFIGGTETLQVAESKYKEITTIFSEDEVG